MSIKSVLDHDNASIPLLACRHYGSIEGTSQEITFTSEFLKAEANIGSIGEDFRKVFLGRKEKNIRNAILGVHILLKEASDVDIIRELGLAAEITLTHLVYLIKNQATGFRGLLEGIKGPLRVNGKSNIAYIRDENNLLWTIIFHWYSSENIWCIEATNPNCPDRKWTDAELIVSHSCL